MNNTNLLAELLNTLKTKPITYIHKFVWAKRHELAVQVEQEAKRYQLNYLQLNHPPALSEDKLTTILLEFCFALPLQAKKFDSLELFIGFIKYPQILKNALQEITLNIQNQPKSSQRKFEVACELISKQLMALGAKVEEINYLRSVAQNRQFHEKTVAEPVKPPSAFVTHMFVGDLRHTGRKKDFVKPVRQASDAQNYRSRSSNNYYLNQDLTFGLRKKSNTNAVNNQTVSHELPIEEFIPSDNEIARIQKFIEMDDKLQILLGKVKFERPVAVCDFMKNSADVLTQEIRQIEKYLKENNISDEQVIKNIISQNIEALFYSINNNPLSQANFNNFIQSIESPALLQQALTKINNHGHSSRRQAMCARVITHQLQIIFFNMRESIAVPNSLKRMRETANLGLFANDHQPNASSSNVSAFNFLADQASTSTSSIPSFNADEAANDPIFLSEEEIQEVLINPSITSNDAEMYLHFNVPKTNDLVNHKDDFFFDFETTDTCDEENLDDEPHAKKMRR